HKTGEAIAGQNLFRIAAIRLLDMDLTPADQRNLSIRSPGAVVSAWNQLSRRAGRNWHDPQVAPVFSFLTTGHQQLGLFGSNGQYVPSRCGGVDNRRFASRCRNLGNNEVVREELIEENAGSVSHQIAFEPAV